MLFLAKTVVAHLKMKHKQLSITPRFHIWLLLLLTAIISCTTEVERTNAEKDIKEAEQFSLKFYNHILHDQLDSAASMFAAHLGHAESLKYLTKVNQLYGHMQEVEGVEIYTNVIEQGNSRKGEFVITNMVDYGSERCKEIVTVTLINSKPKVTGYKSNIIID